MNIALLGFTQHFTKRPPLKGNSMRACNSWGSAVQIGSSTMFYNTMTYRRAFLLNNLPAFNEKPRNVTGVRTTRPNKTQSEANVSKYLYVSAVLSVWNRLERDVLWLLFCFVWKYRALSGAQDRTRTSPDLNGHISFSSMLQWKITWTPQTYAQKL
jgi:hypothetical protein